MPAEDALLKRPGNDLGVAAHASAELLDARGFPHGPSGLYTSHVTAPYALHNLQGDAPSDFNTRQDTHTYQRLIGVQHRQLQESSHYASPINNAANSFDSTSNFTRASFGDSNTSDLSSQSAQSVRHVAGYSFSNASSPDMISDDIDSIGDSQLSGSPAVPFTGAPQAGFSDLLARRDIRAQAGASVVQGFTQGLRSAPTSWPVAEYHASGSDHSAASCTSSASGTGFAPPPSMSAWGANPMPGAMQSTSPSGGMGQVNSMPFTNVGGGSMNLSQPMPVQPLPSTHSTFIHAHQRAMGQQTYQKAMAAPSDEWGRLYQANSSGNGYGNTSCGGGGGGSHGSVYNGSAYGGGGTRFTPPAFLLSGTYGGLMDMPWSGASSTSRHSPEDNRAAYNGMGNFDVHVAYQALVQDSVASQDGPVSAPGGSEHILSALVGRASPDATLDHAPPGYTSASSSVSSYKNPQHQAIAAQQSATYDYNLTIAYPRVDDASAFPMNPIAPRTIDSHLEPLLHTPFSARQAARQSAVLGQDQHAVMHYVPLGSDALSTQDAPIPAPVMSSTVAIVDQTSSQGTVNIQTTSPYTRKVRFSCTICLSPFKYKRSRNKHQKECKEGGPSLCGDCNLMWSSPADRMQHVPHCASKWAPNVENS